jgi:peptidoglycan/xylan/chitin deacetylase (PgdA/CDA1 family)
MTRTFALVFLATVLAFSGCKKLQLPGAKKQAEASQQAEAPADASAGAVPDAPSSPEIAGAAPPSAPDISTGDAAAKPAPAKPMVDTSSQVVVLCYHRLEGKAGGALSIEPKLFEEQMQKIKDEGLAVISMQDFIAWRKGEKSIPPKCVVITIDDGYVSGYEVGWPILKKYGYPFTMYVYLKYINVGGKAITWDQLAEMRDAGVDIGSHTISHQDLRRKPKGAADYDAWLKEEVATSKQTIEEKLGIRVLSIAYPFGLHNEKVHAAVKEAGYEAGFTTYGMRLGHGTAPYALGRYDVTTKDAQGRDSFSVAISFQGMVGPGADPALSQDAAVSMVTQPANGAVIKEVTPTIKANLSTMGEIDPATVEMRISGVGLVKAKYDAASKMLTYEVPANQKLRPGGYTVIISANKGGSKAETRWGFQVDPNATPSSGEDAPLPPRNPRGQ